MMSWPRLSVTFAGAALVLSVAGCGGEDAAPTSTPDGAVVLVENQPSTIDGAQVVAVDVDGDEATLSIATDGPATSVDVSEGGDVEVAGGQYSVEAVWSEGDGDSPGSKGGHVMLVPR